MDGKHHGMGSDSSVIVMNDSLGTKSKNRKDGMRAWRGRGGGGCGSRIKGVSESGLKRDGRVRSGSGTSEFGSLLVFASLQLVKLREGRSARNRGFRVCRRWKLRCC